jgi:hypothetical protein
MNNFLLFPNYHLFVVKIVSNVNLDAKLVSELVDACALGTHNTSNIFLVNVEFGRL